MFTILLQSMSWLVCRQTCVLGLLFAVVRRVGFSALGVSSLDFSARDRLGVIAS